VAADTLSSGAIGAIVVVLILVLLILPIAVFAMFFYRKRRVQKKPAKSDILVQDASFTAPDFHHLAPMSYSGAALVASFSSKELTQTQGSTNSKEIGPKFSSSSNSFLKKSMIKKVAVKINEKSLMLSLPCDTLENFRASIQEQLKPTSDFTIQYLYQKKGVDDYFDLIRIDQLPGKVPQIKVVLKAQKFWAFSINSSEWVSRGHELNRYESLLVKEGERIFNTDVMDKFTRLSSDMGFDSHAVYKIYAISNQMVLGVFDSFRSLLFGKQRQSPQLFNRDDWKQCEDVMLRAAYLTWLEDYCRKFPEWNDANKSKPDVIPLIQGTSEEAAWQICQQGFGVTATTDDGFYGRGVYFTSKLDYASRYAKISSKEQNCQVFLLSMVIPGNTFPVTEHPWDSEMKKSGYHGHACRPGYQAHFTLVDNSGIQNAYPMKVDPPFSYEKVADELVIFDTSQALPLFVFYMRA